MRLFLAFLCGVSGFVAAPALAAPAQDALVACAWSQVAATAATLVGRTKFDAQYQYDADGSPTVGPLMRIWAACARERAALLAAGSYDNRDFLKRLRRSRPTALGPDLFTVPVFRCETRFRDDPQSAQPVAISWGYGEDTSMHQLRYTQTVQGSPILVSSAMLDDDKALRAVLKSAQGMADEALAVECRKDGDASGKPYVVKDGGGRSVCQIVHSNGSYTDA